MLGLDMTFPKIQVPLCSVAFTADSATDTPAPVSSIRASSELRAAAIPVQNCQKTGLIEANPPKGIAKVGNRENTPFNP